MRSPRSLIASTLAPALAFALLAACSPPEATLATPDGAVVQYVRGLATGRLDQSYAALSPTLQVDCPRAEFNQHALTAEREAERSRVTLRDVRTAGDSATVITLIDSGGRPGPFAGDTGYEAMYQLTRENGEWRLAEFTWPYLPCAQFPGREPIPPIQGTFSHTEPRFHPEPEAKDLS